MHEVLYFYGAEELDGILTDYFQNVLGVSSIVETEFDLIIEYGGIGIKFRARCIKEDGTSTELTDETIITALTKNEVSDPSLYKIVPYLSSEDRPRFKLKIEPKKRQRKR